MLTRGCRTMIEITPLNPELIHRANSNSFNGNRGNHSNSSYISYCQEVLEWPIADSRKEKLLFEVHKRYSVILNYEAQHVSVMVAEPARYNAKRLDKGDQVLRSSHEFCECKREEEHDCSKELQQRRDTTRPCSDYSSGTPARTAISVSA